MQIKDIFKKDIDRKISAVVTLDTEEKDILRQEIEEYVVTDEIQDRLTQFFDVWIKAESTSTDETGVWISGFFGSGKSHFLKILSYLLDNEEIDGKRAIDYFIEDGKIEDAQLLENIKQAADVDTKVILFDVDTKSDTNAHNDENVLVKVFYRVFMDMQGYYGSIPAVARLERDLAQKGQYNAFQDEFNKLTNSSWLESRNEFDFLEDDIVEALTNIGYMSEDAARNWATRAQNDFVMDVDTFAGEVEEYIQRTGNRVAFLADEIGQYIGVDSALMLKLQSITKALGTHSRGKAWMIVTSQQEFDEEIANKGISAVNGRDFSKIQARFNTRLSLQSTNVGEVISKRLFDKQDDKKAQLAEIYSANEMTIRNLIQFSGGAEKKLFKDVDDYVQNYPAIPYQVNLLGKVLNEIRNHSASGRSMSEGERSMLGFFQKAVQQIEDENTEHLIAFDQFYDSVQANLDDSHQRVIVQAGENSLIQENKDINLRVLKVLLLIKYLPQEIHATVGNITSLLIRSITEDRLSLQKEVEGALRVLESENYIRNEIDQYFFLTNEEQDVNLEIKNKQVSEATVTAKTMNLVFDDILDGAMKIKAAGRQTPFQFGRVVDDQLTSADQNTELRLRLLTSRASLYQSGDEAIGLALSGKPEVLVKLNDDQFMTEIVLASKIEQWIRSGESSGLEGYSRIKEEKQKELAKHNAEATRLLKMALTNSDVYVQGSELDVSGDILTRVQQAETELIKRVYYKLDNIDVNKTLNDVDNLLSGIEQVGLEENKKALSDMRDWIFRKGQLLGLKEVLDTFQKIPYGYAEIDTEWLVAKLYIDRDIELWVNSVQRDDNNSSPQELLKMFTNARESEKVQLKLHEKMDQGLIDLAKKLASEMHMTIIDNDETVVMKQFVTKTRQNFMVSLDTYTNQKSPLPGIGYPGSAVLDSMKQKMNDILNVSTTKDFYGAISKHAEDLIEDIDDYSDVENFYKGQKELWDNAAKVVKIYDEGRLYIHETEIQQVVEKIRSILKSNRFNQIHELSDLRNKFNDLYLPIADSQQSEALTKIDSLDQFINDKITDNDVTELSARYLSEVRTLRQKVEASTVLSVYNYVDKDIEEIQNSLNRAIYQALEARAKKANEDVGGKNGIVTPAAQPKNRVSKRFVGRRATVTSVEEIDEVLEQMKQELVRSLQNADEVDITF